MTVIHTATRLTGKATPAAAHVRFAGISKAFGSKRVVDDLHLDIETGEFLVLIGPSGCGKTTSLRMLAGFEEPTAGRIMLRERDITQQAPRDRNMAMVFQNYALYPHMTAAENMGFALKLRGTPRATIAQRVGEVAALLGIDELLQRKPRELSGGQRQRVAVGRAIVRDPEVFLFDEPLSNLDAQIRATARSEIRSLQRKLGVTTVYVTHDQVEAMTMADRIAVMKDGKLLQCADPLTIYERPADTFVAAFVGAPAVNLVDTAALLASVLAGPGVRACLGAATTLGIRPEHLLLAGRSQPTDSTLRLHATLERFELLGAETIVTARITSGDLLQVRMPGAYLAAAGTVVPLNVDLERVLGFDQAGRRMELVTPRPVTTAPTPGLMGALRQAG